MTRFSLTLSFAGIWLMSGCGARTSDDDLLGPYTPGAGVGGASTGGNVGSGGEIGAGGTPSVGGTGGTAAGGTGGGTSGNCCVGTGEPGCADPVVAQCVCEFDAFCCTQAWDQACVEEADEFCRAECSVSTGGTNSGGTAGSGGDIGSGGMPAGGTGGTNPGNCCEFHGGTGCQNPTVQACVCDIDPFCCDTSWDAICVNRVSNNCGVQCTDPGTGGTGGMPTGGTGGTGGSGGTGGVIGQCEAVFPDECGSCTCNNCFDELETCLSDFGCISTLACIERTGCDLVGCYQPSTCQGTIDTFGGLAGVSVQRAFGLGICVATSGCPCD